MTKAKTKGLEPSRKIIVAALGLPVSADRKKVLLTQRHAPDYPAWHLKWQVAGGGINFGETMEEAVVREVWEELHVKAQILYPHPIVKTSIWYADESDEKMDTQVILVLYLVDIGDQIPDLSQDPDWETSAWGWYTLEEARALDTLPLTLPAIEEAFQLLTHMISYSYKE
jgi:8-oxo-dGTP pyrophosphatase MutT (NUDIX family)